ncbi:UNVERIFIED_CONTAM: hypothetical protein I5919_22630, partial [Aeromonas hydrophila]
LPAGLGFGAALGIAFLSTGFVTPLALFGAAALSAVACPELRTARRARFLAAAAVALAAVALTWPLALRSQSPALFAEWLAIAT